MIFLASTHVRSLILTVKENMLMSFLDYLLAILLPPVLLILPSALLASFGLWVAEWFRE